MFTLLNENLFVYNYVLIQWMNMTGNCVFVSFTDNVPIMSALSVQGSNDQFCFYPKNNNAGKNKSTN